MYRQYIAEDMSSGEYPPYKASGMAYIRFADEERELFRLLFMNKNGRTDGFEGWVYTAINYFLRMKKVDFPRLFGDRLY